MKRFYKGKNILLTNTLAKRVIQENSLHQQKNANWSKGFPKEIFNKEDYLVTRKLKTFHGNHQLFLLNLNLN